jgi:soluble lytic murein transglycosylase-like protein
LALAFLAPASSSASSFPDRYDDDIRSAVKRYWPDYPFWRAWKAQLYQESRLQPDAVSPVGARGLAQFMPGTWADVAREIGAGTASPHEARWAIPAGAYYMARLRRSWSSPRPQDDRHRLAQASYNAGLGNILKAQQRCGGARHYPEIIPCLEAVTGPRNSHETRTYVERIARWWAMMEARL